MAVTDRLGDRVPSSKHWTHGDNTEIIYNKFSENRTKSPEMNTDIDDWDTLQEYCKNNNRTSVL